MLAHSRFSLLMILLSLLSASPLPAQDATAKLKAQITTALERSYAPSAFKIAVTTPGRVVIDGEVPSYWDKQNVFAIVARVPGVKDISNRLVVQTIFVSAPIVKVELEEYLKRMRAIKDLDKITVTVRMPEGQVILGGTVNFPHEKALMEEIAAWHRGVKEVDNQIEVLSRDKLVSDAALARAIKDMLSCDFPREAKTVQVKIEKGQVLLSGAVTRLWAKLEIEKAVQNTGGVRQVESRLEVIGE
ncbi:BON domain-containing protein [candidate division KSB1 bacterium]|nr:BON domain-containing protein [candidate division KSB1 bacterium]